jgi:hypothetical protein
MWAVSQHTDAAKSSTCEDLTALKTWAKFFSMHTRPYGTVKVSEDLEVSPPRPINLRLPKEILENLTEQEKTLLAEASAQETLIIAIRDGIVTARYLAAKSLREKRLFQWKGCFNSVSKKEICARYALSPLGQAVVDVIFEGSNSTSRRFS